ncbi:MAG: hypothetical protein EB078_03700 [Proteobacteria bacterium]|nr:hypothetical protein [Pseudomonadota bacterium]NDC23873.1 hypothetical protein [Pseudomonadota bacterium]NDD03987.1 hypothetical protein [Pseudomonadota bacterium]NDG26537.1 hypothetical protein [Pseudomonadota bacterium]
MRLFFAILSLCGLGFPLLAATYSDPQHRISFQYDDTLWETGAPKRNDVETLVSLQRRTPDKEGDTTYFSRLSIVKEDWSKIKTVKESKLPRLEAYKNHAAEFLKSQRFDILSAAVRKTTGIPDGIFEIVARQRDFGLTFQQVGFLEKENAYLVTITVRTQKFPEYQTEINQILNSLKINNP